VVIAASCKPTRIEYRTRPEFYEKAGGGRVGEEVTLEDGTVLTFRSVRSQSSFGRTGDDRFEPFQIREESEEGEIVLRSAVPEHVLVNTLTCLRNEEYELLFDQMIAGQTKKAYEAQEQGEEEVIAFFRKHRHDLVATLTRMVAGMPHEEVKVGPAGNGVTRCRLRPQFAGPFKFKEVDIVKEEGGLKLLMIR
jgi:hypothetical protein